MTNVFSIYQFRRHILAIFLAAVAAVALPQHADADDTQDCTNAAGTLLTGTVYAAPTLAYGKVRDGIELSHTHIIVSNDSGLYDVAVDNVFASGYDGNSDVIPWPLSTISVGQQVEACGIPYDGGMHWVHNNCGATPSPAQPNGWFKQLAPDGTPGPNIEDNHAYCYLW